MNEIDSTVETSMQCADVLQHSGNTEFFRNVCPNSEAWPMILTFVLLTTNSHLTTTCAAQTRMLTVAGET